MTISTTPALLDDDRLTLAGLFIESAAGVRHPVERQLAEHGLVNAWFEVLIRLARSPDHRLRMSDLAAQADLSLSGLTRAVDRLVDQGLIERRSCPTDRRGAFAELTAAGMDRVAEVLPGHVEVLEQTLLAALDERERDQLESLLRKVRDHVNPGAATITTRSSC